MGVDMMVLAVESATELAGVALADEAGVLATVTVSRGRHHAESIAPAIDFACRRAGVGLSDLDAVGVDVGPGLFTGLRVGVGTAQALAFGLDKPLVGVVSLEVLAYAAATSGAAPGTLVVPVVDARRGEVFVARLRTTTEGVSWEEPEARRSPELLADELAGVGEPFVLVGDGARRHGALLGAVPGAVLVGEALTFPPPGVLASLAVRKAAAGELHAPSNVLPHYLRDADTRIKWETRARPGVER
ncbi:MAG: tRNA (adenosine(37)-N6)-threonylcarbamoyltransferase complex dimerization subunit type 1 TsaB [Acidimicrobiales bacterium]|nr:tRNA (adenosine(37)-N6)-threonylcarbamoyltransferase complex dimerization subunit type 1 TsaB [Acidimicrobiales bacterium]